MRSTDAEILPAIERSAAEAFRALPDLAWVAGREVAAAEDRLAAMERGPVWVAVDEGDVPLGFVSTEVVGDRLHVRELSVQQASQRQGLGRALMERATRWARGRGLAALTLTTFRDLAWNGRFYQRLGFEEVAPHDLSPDLAQTLAHEVARGLPGERRCAMRLTLGRPWEARVTDRRGEP